MTVTTTIRRLNLRYGGGTRTAVLDLREGAIAGNAGLVEYAEPTDGIAPVDVIHANHGGERYYQARSGLSGAGWIIDRPYLLQVPTMRVDVGRPDLINPTAGPVDPRTGEYPVVVYRRGMPGETLYVSVDTDFEIAVRTHWERTEDATTRGASGCYPVHHYIDPDGSLTQYPMRDIEWVTVAATGGVDRRVAQLLAAGMLEARCSGPAQTATPQLMHGTEWCRALEIDQLVGDLVDDRWMHVRHGRVTPLPDAEVDPWAPMDKWGSGAVLAGPTGRPDVSALAPSSYSVVGDHLVDRDGRVISPPWGVDVDIVLPPDALLALWRGNPEEAASVIATYPTE